MQIAAVPYCVQINHLAYFQSVKTLGVFQKPGLFDKGVGALLPEAYKKFYKEWKLTEPSAVHYVPEEGKFKRNELTGDVYVDQNKLQTCRCMFFVEFQCKTSHCLYCIPRITTNRYGVGKESSKASKSVTKEVEECLIFGFQF